MNRRDAMVTLTSALATAAFVATPRVVLAQATAEPTTNATLTLPHYRLQTLAGGSFAKQTSELALTQATNPKVKEFAQFEVNEQTTLAQALTNLNNPPAPPLDPHHAQLMKELQSQSRKSFDVAYVQGQLAGHQQLLNIQQAFLNAVPVDRDAKHIAMLARTSIQMHIVMLNDLQTQLTA